MKYSLADLLLPILQRRGCRTGWRICQSLISRLRPEFSQPSSIPPYITLYRHHCLAGRLGDGVNYIRCFFFER